jgi:hypothetical protein
MNAGHDPLLNRSRPDRLHYATGQLLGADDFVVEQTYHRHQLARALLFLHGSGSVAGLRAEARHQPGQNGGSDEVELRIQPGLALDRVGRLIEVAKPACLRLRRWFEHGANQPPGQEGLNRGDLRGAWRTDGTVTAGGVVVADVFLAFHPCDRGYTPTFASGPFDALDASQPSRVRDGYELTLVPRSEPDAELPVAPNPWAAISGDTTAERLDAARALSLDAWETLAQPIANPGGDGHENPAGTDPHAVLIARLRLPAAAPTSVTSAPVPDWTSAAWPDATANLNNHVRNFLLPPAACLRVAGLET